MLLLVLLGLVAGTARAQPFTVCAVSFHSADEIAVFEDYLQAPDFTLVSLAPVGKRANEKGKGSWLANACRPKLRCDIVVLSGEFGGRFFGDSGFSLGLQELEEASCDPACDGLFRAPSEVFLLACNTLATKDQDQRTPREYLRVLQDHGFDQAAAERVVQMRYGPVGPSFREAMRRVFMGVPRIYGFASVAPRGMTTGPMLERYFGARGDYVTYLDRAGRSPQRNERLLHAFAGTGLVQAAGLAADEPAARDRELACRLYDEHRSVADRLRTASELMARQDFLAFLPTMEVFVRRHPADSLERDERALFDVLRDRPAARDEVLRLARDLEVSALKLEVAHFALHMGWTTPQEFHRLAVDGAHALLARPLTSEIVDIECEIAKHERVGDTIGSDELPGLLFRNAEGLRLIDCLAPMDREVSTRLAAALDDADASTRAWAAYALSRRLPLDEAVETKLASHLDDASAEVRELVQWIFTNERDVSSAARTMIRARDPKLARRSGWRW